ncbi:MAG TPA: ComEC/Rec2 family competence protein [Chthoniobacterales bacterium]|nr:ComEC/Rec2 family competence protein [Chthoniobacterales bacterium]
MKPSSAWPRQPFIGLAIAASVGILVADWQPGSTPSGLIAFAICAGVAFLLRNSTAVYVLVAGAFFLLHSMRITDAPGVRLARQLDSEPRPVTAVGSVVSEPKISARGLSSFLLRLDSIDQDGRVLATNATITARWRGQAKFGNQLRLFGVAERIAPPRNPGEFDMRSYLARQDVYHGLLVRYAENGRVLSQAGGNPIWRAAQQSRKWMQSALSRGLEDSPEIHGLISGMVLGARDETPDEIEEQFQQTGTLHLFAVSGLNVAIVAQLLWIIAVAARIPRRWAIALIIPALFFYAAITGLNTSSVRAALMGAILLGGFFVERKVLLINSVAAAAFLVLCWDTNQIFSTGFQLSFAVVLAIILLADRLYRLLVRWWEPDPFLPRSLLGHVPRLSERAWHAVARGLSVSLAAWIGSAFLILPYFHLITPVSLLANLVVVPLAFLVLAVGLVSLLLAPFASALTVIFNNANWSLAWLILGAVQLFARAPASHMYLERPRWPDGAHAEITVLDLNEGAAVHIRSAGRDWLFDPGAERDFKRVLRSYLRSRGVNRLDGLALSHGDATHIGGGAAVMHAFRPRLLVDSPAPDRSIVHRRLIKEGAERSIPRKLVVAGDEFPISKSMTARVFFPPQDFRGRIADDQALVVQLILPGNTRVLLMSDSGESTERALLARDADLRSDLLIKGQHHSGTSGSAEFLDAVQPQAIIATAREPAENQRIKEDWAEMVKQRRITLLRQDKTGAVSVRFFDDHWEAVPFLDGETFRSTSR